MPKNVSDDSGDLKVCIIVPNRHSLVSQDEDEEAGSEAEAAGAERRAACGVPRAACGVRRVASVCVCAFVPGSAERVRVY